MTLQQKLKKNILSTKLTNQILKSNVISPLYNHNIVKLCFIALFYDKFLLFTTIVVVVVVYNFCRCRQTSKGLTVPGLFGPDLIGPDNSAYFSMWDTSYGSAFLTRNLMSVYVHQNRKLNYIVSKRKVSESE